MKPCLVSIVIPVYNEEENIERFYSEIIKAIENRIDYEIVYIDDGSSDNSLELMVKISETDKKVKVIQLNRNWGQQNAMYIGLAHVRGAAVIMLDGDGQFDASCIVDLSREMFEKDHDLVSGIRKSRKDKWVNRFNSKIGNSLINRALQITQTDFGAVRAFRRNLVDKILSCTTANQSVHPYAMAYQLCTSYSEIVVKHHHRSLGKSKWNSLKRLNVYFDIFVSFYPYPFKWLFGLAIITIGGGILLSLGILIYRLTYPHVNFSGLIIFFALFLIITGIAFFVLAILGDFVLRVYRSNFLQNADSTIKKFTNMK